MSHIAPKPTQRLEPNQCWELLGQTDVGRLAVIVDVHPDIFPVNYVLDRGSIVLRAGDGTKPWSATRDLCAFEIDGDETDSGKAWSVVVRGRVHLIMAPDEKSAVDALHLDPW